MKDRYIKRLVAKSKCAVCGVPYRIDNVSVLGHEDEFWFLSVFCENCKHERLVAALVRSQQVHDISIEEMPTALAPSEAAHFAQLPPIGYDDVLDIHGFLQEFDGNFHRLFGTEARD